MALCLLQLRQTIWSVLNLFTRHKIKHTTVMSMLKIVVCGSIYWMFNEQLPDTYLSVYSMHNYFGEHWKVAHSTNYVECLNAWYFTGQMQSNYINDSMRKRLQVWIILGVEQKPSDTMLLACFNQPIQYKTLFGGRKKVEFGGLSVNWESS
jgi:hypothetical protein